MARLVGHVPPTLVVFSMDDEYVPPHVDKAALLERLATATQARVLALDSANHSIDDPALWPQLMETVQAFLASLV